MRVVKVVGVTWVAAFGDFCATHVILAKAGIQRLSTRGSRFAIQLFTPILAFPLRGKDSRTPCPTVVQRSPFAGTTKGGARTGVLSL